MDASQCTKTDCRMYDICMLKDISERCSIFRAWTHFAAHEIHADVPGREKEREGKTAAHIRAAA